MTSTSLDETPSPAAPVVGSRRARTLVASYCFPPFNDAAGIVAAKRVREAGEPVDVVANAMDRIRPRDPGLARIADDLVRRLALLETPTAFSSWGSVRDYTRAGVRQALEWERDSGPYEKVYSRAQFAASHFLAARFVLLRPGLSWRAEFSDPLSHDVTGGVRHAPLADDELTQRLRDGLVRAGATPPCGDNLFEWCEHLVFALADEIVFTNEGQAELMLSRCADRALAERAAAHATISPHPTLPRRFYRLGSADHPLDEHRRHIGYFGNFYATRGMGTILTALAGLPEQVRDRLQLHVFTSKPAELRREVRRAGLDEVVQAGPFADYLDFLALTTRFDCLLVGDAQTPEGAAANPFLPSKWSDYAGSGTPVWGVVDEDSPLSRRPLDHRSPIGHVTAAQQVLSSVASGPRRG